MAGRISKAVDDRFSRRAEAEYHIIHYRLPTGNSAEMADLAGRYGTLLAVDAENGQERKLYEFGYRLQLVHVHNHTLEPDGSRKDYWLAVPGRYDTPNEAIASTFGIHPNYYKVAVAS